MDKPILIVSSEKDEKLIASIRSGFEEKFNAKLDFEVRENAKITGGFIAIIDGKVYDASYTSRLHELARQMMTSIKGKGDVESSFSTVGSLLKERMKASNPDPLIYEYGVVKSYNDDIVHVTGLSKCHYGELLSFDNGAVALALDLEPGLVGAALLDGDVSTSAVVQTTGRIAEICVGEELLGRVIDPLGRPIDGKELQTKRYRPVEAPAPTIMQRSPVNTPLETGVLAIDSMIPIGRGQRELIIGDRQTGKTSLALTAIMNQRRTDVLCVYCAIGQKAATVSSLTHTLERNGALEHTVIVAAMAHDTPTLQYLAPYAACAIAEEFMYSGRDVLVVYDDLSKHAVAYRTMSLLLRRPSGREAYPGDVFYLHSRLLERAAKLSPQMGSGSMTALPIVETMVGDISAYIPTNVISITDGQIYLETGLFNAGQRPAVNVGLSVSRVGRSAQHKAMQNVSASLRLEIAQYRDMAVFAQFGADIDAATSALLRRGERLVKLLIQPSELVYKLSDQVILLLAASEGFFDELEINEVPMLAESLLEYVRENRKKMVSRVDSTNDLSKKVRAELISTISLFFGGDVRELEEPKEETEEETDAEAE